jgi:hypothetical protein
MSRIFRDILVTVEPEPGAHELVDCMEELNSIHKELGENHEHAVFAQVFGHLDSKAKYYITGKILTPDQAHRIKAILTE